MQAISRVARSFFLVLLPMAVFSVLPPGSAGAGTGARSQLVLRVAEEAALEARGPDVIVKVRLDRGVTARIWGATDCNLATSHSTSISASGTYTFPAASLAGADDAVICLASSDQKLRVQASLR